MTKTLIWDIETDGLLPTMTRIHCLVIRDAATRETFRFRRREAHLAFECHPVTKPGVLSPIEAEDTIADGVAMLESADIIVGHNVIGFDIKAVQKIFPTFRPPLHKVRDTLPLTRVIMPDTYDSDIPLWKAGRLPGALIKSHSLDAWGYRTGARKGDYSAQMEALGKNPWASWNMDLEDYCEVDDDVTEVLWAAIQSAMPPDEAVELEHAVHDLCAVLENNGFPFDREGAIALQDHLQSEYEKVTDAAKAAFGPWFAPEKKYRVAPMWDDPEGANQAKYEADMRAEATGAAPEKLRKYYKPRPEFGEDMSRAWWGDVFVPAKAARFRSRVPAELCGLDINGEPALYSHRSPDAPYCKIIKKDFNPGSRHDVIDRFQQVYGWEPKEFTENGNPEVNDGVLRGLASTIPVAEHIAECFFINKYLGQIAHGKQAWLKTYNKDTGGIHCYINVGGTVSGRCSHVGPNLGQVPACIEAAVRLKDGSPNPKLCGLSGALLPHCFDWDGNEKKEAPLLGRNGEWGWECRSLFGVPPEWVQVGVDLSGIEFRCLAELTLPFDDGELIEVIKSGQDIHAFNQKKTGIENRGVIKRCLYGLMYGAGDYKLGITADPSLTGDEVAATRLGKQIREQIMAGLPALKRAIELVQREAACGYLIGLDGRKLHCRHEYSALNLRLQSNAALLAKKWLVLTERNALARGWDHGWFSGMNSDGFGDFAMMAFVHDEQQNAVRPELMRDFGKVATDAALESGKYFNFVCPIEAKAKFGRTWAECH